MSAPSTTSTTTTTTPAAPKSIATDVPPYLARAVHLSYNPSTAIPSLAPKTYLITGATSGIGRATAIELARHSPAQIWVLGRNAEAGRESVGAIQRAGKEEVHVRFVQCDLSSFESVEKACSLVLGTRGAERLDVVCLNAGMMGGHPGTTPEGFEKQFGTNHVGHALLLKLLTPLLLKTAEENPATKPRVVIVSSTGHKNALPDGGIAFATLKSAQLDLSGVSKYTQSKLANVVYARQFAAHYPQLVSIAIHPGNVETEMFNKGAIGGGPEMEYLAKVVAPKVGVSLEEGIKNLCWAVTAETGVESGRYYEPVGVTGMGSHLSKDKEFGRKLWEWTEEALEEHGV